MFRAPLAIGVIALAAVLFSPSSSKGNVVFIGGLDIGIPIDFDGVYIDLQEGSVASSPTEPANWDINFFFGGSGIANHLDLQPVKQAAASLSPVLNLPTGTFIDGTLNYGTGFGGSGGSAGTPLDHMDTGSSPQPFTNGERGYIGFSWDHDGDGGSGTAVRYGYFDVTLRNDGTPGTVHAVYYETDPGVGILIPEPGVASLLAAALLLPLFRRRRK